MKKEERLIFYDNDLEIEAYKFSGINQKFPNHFHDYYVIGAITKGQSIFYSKNYSKDLHKNDLLLLNPQDNHACEPCPDKLFEYYGLNVPQETMQALNKELTGKDTFPVFKKPVEQNIFLVNLLKQIYTMIKKNTTAFKKQENFYFFMDQLLSEYTTAQPIQKEELRKELAIVCQHMESNYAQNITLAELATISGLSKYHLLRSFVREKGISPYRYLETIRINKAKELLQKQIPVHQVAIDTGFSDQSHFSNFFKEFIGLTPKQYMNIFKEESL